MAIVAAMLVLLSVAFVIWLNYTPAARAPILPTSTPLPLARNFSVEPTESALTATADTPLGPLESSYQMGPGTVELNQEADGWRVVINLTFDARSLDVGSDAFNTIVRRILRVDEFPIGSFVASSEELITDISEPTTVTMVGQMELHGTIQELSIPTTVILDEDGKLTLDAQAMIEARFFGEMEEGNQFSTAQMDADMQVVSYEGGLDAEVTEAPHG